MLWWCLSSSSWENYIISFLDSGLGLWFVKPFEFWVRNTVISHFLPVCVLENERDILLAQGTCWLVKPLEARVDAIYSHVSVITVFVSWVEVLLRQSFLRSFWFIKPFESWVQNTIW